RASPAARSCAVAGALSGARDPHRPLVPAAPDPVLRDPAALAGPEVGLMARAVGAAVAVAALLGRVGTGSAQPPQEIAARTTLTPSVVRIGEPVHYEGRAIVRFGLPVTLLPPEPDPDLTWRNVKSRGISGRIRGS